MLDPKQREHLVFRRGRSINSILPAVRRGKQNIGLDFVFSKHARPTLAKRRNYVVAQGLQAPRKTFPIEEDENKCTDDDKLGALLVALPYPLVCIRQAMQF